MRIVDDVRPALAIRNITQQNVCAASHCRLAVLLFPLRVFTVGCWACRSAVGAGLCWHAPTASVCLMRCLLSKAVMSSSPSRRTHPEPAEIPRKNSRECLRSNEPAWRAKKEPSALILAARNEERCAGVIPKKVRSIGKGGVAVQSALAE